MPYEALHAIRASPPAGVAETTRDLLSGWPAGRAKEIVLLSDAASPVTVQTWTRWNPRSTAEPRGALAAYVIDRPIAMSASTQGFESAGQQFEDEMRAAGVTVCTVDAFAQTLR